MLLPPSTLMMALVIYLPALLASIKQGPSISSFVPDLPSGVLSATFSAAGSRVRCFGSVAVGEDVEVISVGNVPGSMVLTRIFNLQLT